MIVWLIAAVLAQEPLPPGVNYQAGSGALEICGVQAPGPQELIEKVMSLPDLKMLERKEQYLTLVNDSERRFWTFAVDGHPASPAIICRTIEPKENGGSTLRMEISCFADKASCDQLTADFVAHDSKILQEAASK